MAINRQQTAEQPSVSPPPSAEPLVDAESRIWGSAPYRTTTPELDDVLLRLVDFLAARVAEPRVERVAFTKAEAAKALGVSTDFFDDHIAAEVKTVRRGSKQLVAAREIARWLEQEAERTLP